MTIFYLTSRLASKKLSYAKLARVDDLASKPDKFDSIPDPFFCAINCLFLAVMAAKRIIWTDQGTSMRGLTFSSCSLNKEVSILEEKH